MNAWTIAWVCLAINCCLDANVFGQENPLDPREVQWLQSATEAARLARETGKPILVYVRSENCHYCDLLQKKTWQDPATQAMIMRDMVPLKLTLEENREAVKAMKVKGYPSTVIFSANREYLARIDGFMTPEDFVKHLSKAKLAMRQPDSREMIR